MSNRARATRPEGAADSAESPRTPPGADGSGRSNGTSQSAPNGRTTPASNGATGPATAPSGQDTVGNRPPRPAPAPANSTAAPVRPPQQPPVRPMTGQAPTGASAAAGPAATTSVTSQRPESRVPTQASANQPSASAAYGQSGSAASAATGAMPVTDRGGPAKQATLDNAATRDPAVGSSSARTTDQRGSTAKASTRPQTRKARLRLSRVDPWSVMKTSFLLAIAFGIVTWVAVFIVWSAIGAAGVFDNINNTVSEVLGTPTAEPFRIENYINTGKVMGFTTLLACADVLIITALATLGSFLYNIAATLLGGLEVTLASED
jgi:hypothetical protein